ncbi:MAG: hypothetical protein QM572_12155 [Nocardioides sp.]|uniref:hypothetical protein n=1 Tax=Nocardioides sp. TaxID=35761 RepID=UPI0039E70325
MEHRTALAVAFATVAVGVSAAYAGVTLYQEPTLAVVPTAIEAAQQTSTPTVEETRYVDEWVPVVEYVAGPGIASTASPTTSASPTASVTTSATKRPTAEPTATPTGTPSAAPSPPTVSLPPLSVPPSTSGTPSPSASTTDTVSASPLPDDEEEHD